MRRDSKKANDIWNINWKRCSHVTTHGSIFLMPNMIYVKRIFKKEKLSAQNDEAADID